MLMCADEYNRRAEVPEVEAAIERAKDIVCGSTDYIHMRCLDPDSWGFMRSFRIHVEDIADAIIRLRVADYNTTSCKINHPDAHVFGVIIPLFSLRDEVYLKFSFDRSGIYIEMFSCHEPKRKLEHPYR